MQPSEFLIAQDQLEGPQDVDVTHEKSDPAIIALSINFSPEGHVLHD
jgi:hypothetical protein